MLSENNNMANDGCPLCWANTGRHVTPFERLFPQLTRGDQILLRSPRGTFAMIDIAPIGLGHSLIVTSKHALSIADASPSEVQGAISLMREIGQRISNAWPLDHVFFEHGQRAEHYHPYGCSIVHAHIHAVATQGPLDLDSIEGVDFQPHFGGLRTLSSAVGESSYLYVQDMQGNAWVAQPERSASQILRRHFSRNPTGHQDLYWNWSDQILLADTLSTRDRVLTNLRQLRVADHFQE
jgi:diadenosine tetraphosphate (Ap4A) HIT family hydrolase